MLIVEEKNLEIRGVKYPSQCPIVRQKMTDTWLKTCGADNPRKSEKIKEKLVLQMGKGITIYKGEKGFLKDNFHHHEACDIVFTVVTRLEVRRLKNLVHTIDPHAFVFTNTIKEVAGKGGVVKHRKGH